MSLEININQAIKEAMMAKEAKKLEALRAVKAAILLAKTEKAGITELDQTVEIAILQKLVKQRRESALIYTQNNREELAQQETFEADIIATFLPAQLSKTELLTLVTELAIANEVKTVKDMGKLMGLVNKAVAGKAEGKDVAACVKEYLNSLS